MSSHTPATDASGTVFLHKIGRSPNFRRNMRSARLQPRSTKQCPAFRSIRGGVSHHPAPGRPRRPVSSPVHSGGVPWESPGPALRRREAPRPTNERRNGRTVERWNGAPFRELDIEGKPFHPLIPDQHLSRYQSTVRNGPSNQQLLYTR